jgi:hypothetical protein
MSETKTIMTDDLEHQWRKLSNMLSKQATDTHNEASSILDQTVMLLLAKKWKWPTQSRNRRSVPKCPRRPTLATRQTYQDRRRETPGAQSKHGRQRSRPSTSRSPQGSQTHQPRHSRSTPERKERHVIQNATTDTTKHTRNNERAHQTKPSTTRTFNQTKSAQTIPLQCLMRKHGISW